MYFRFHYIFLASSPHAAPDERGRAHPPLCNGEGWGGGEKKKKTGREKAIRKRRKETRSAPQPVQADTASPGRAGPARAGPLRCPQARGRAAGTPALPCFGPLWATTEKMRAAGSFPSSPARGWARSVSPVRPLPKQAGGSSGICIATHADVLLHGSPQRD